jgi:hypothetical protein
MQSVTQSANALRQHTAPIRDANMRRQKKEASRLRELTDLLTPAQSWSRCLSPYF